jgi:hypothetical protein
MADSCFITLEGVIQQNVSYAPIATGLGLYHGLATTFNILIGTDSFKKEADYWLSMEGLSVHGAVEYNDNIRSNFTPARRRLDQVVAMRNRGYNISLVIEPDPSCAAVLLSEGFTVANLVHNQYALPQWRPDYKYENRPWSSFEKSITRMNELKAIDKRLKEED